MRVIVCGGRVYNDRAHAFTRLDLLHELYGIDHVTHGACGASKSNPDPRKYKGADRWAHEWAVARGIPVTPVPADWDRCGSVAGRMRNREMLDMEPIADAVVAFPGGPGTAHMVRIATTQNVRVIQC